MNGRFLGMLVAGAMLGLGGSAVAQSAAPSRPVDATLRSTPDTIVWGYFPSDVQPVLRIKSGQTVRIDTISHQGLINGTDPVSFFAAAGIPADQVLPDAVEVYQKAPHAKGSSAHVLTGPIYVEGAVPGDMLEVRMIDFDFRVPYGVNNTGKGAGVLPALLAGPSPKIIKFDTKRRVALFSDDIEVPLAPFMGIMAVAPPPNLSLVSSRPPGAWGGNMDFRQLVAGSTLYLPVFNDGALFYTGDSHAVQADGEVDGTAIEASLTPTLQFIVHKGAGKTMHWPRAEDAANYYVMGMDLDLNLAMKNAVQEAVDFLCDKAALSPADAYALASLAVDFRVGEAVDAVQMVYGMVPKKLFKQNPEYWAK
jgi:acetamidase/formamidase